MRKILFIFAGLIIVTLQACIYRMDIPQGNKIDPARLDQLKVGMTRSQVVYLLGDAAITDQFHANQSHYVYYLYKGEEQQSEQKTMVLTYDNDILMDIEGSL